MASRTAPRVPYSLDAPQRVSLLSGLPALLAEYGVPFERAVDGLPVDPKAFDDPDERVPYWVASRVLGRAAQLSGRPDFGLILGSRYDHRSLGVPGQLLQHSPTLESALDAFVSMQHSNSRGAAAYLHRYGDTAIFGYGVYDRDATAHEQIYALIMALAFNIVRTLTGGSAKASKVLLSTRPPTDPTAFSSWFGVPVHFSQTQSGLVLSRRALNARIPGARPEELERLMRLAAQAIPPSDRVWTDRAKHLLRPMLLRGETTIASAATRLGLSVRTLSRRLAGENMTFQRVLDEVRLAMATELLAITDLPIGDISDALSYAAHASFVDAFRRWTGTSPSRWRDEVRARSECSAGSGSAPRQ